MDSRVSFFLHHAPLDLPLFNEPGRIFVKKEITSISVAPSRLFFIGDSTGDLKVWKWVAKEKEGVSAGV